MDRKRGNRLGFWFFKMALKLFGLRGSYCLLYLVVPYYLLFDRRAVLSIAPYIEKIFPGVSFLQRYKHAFFVFLHQARQLIDRYAYLRHEGIFRISLKDRGDFMSQLRSKTDKGFIILNSHIGNWQLSIKALKEQDLIDRSVHIVMRPEYNPAVLNALKLYEDGENLKTIHPSEENLWGVIDIMNALKHGEIVAMTGDRCYGAETVEVDFLGATASFPYSAFKIAAELECPIVVLLAYKSSRTEYVIELSDLLLPEYSGKNDKAEQLKPYVQKYADIVSGFLKKHPYNCFIFDDVWEN